MNKNNNNKTIIPISDLKISEFNVRKDAGDVSELTKSISEKGILQPLLVRPENGKYGVIIGSRRFTAAKEAKLKEIPVIISEMSDDEALTLSLIENIQRNDLDPKQTADALVMLLKQFSSRQLAKKIGKSDSYVVSMAGTAQLLSTLERHDIKASMYPSEEKRSIGKAIPVQHAIYLAETVRSAPDIDELKQIDLVKAIAPKTQDEAFKITQYAKKHPQKPVSEIVYNGLYEEKDRLERQRLFREQQQEQQKPENDPMTAEYIKTHEEEVKRDELVLSLIRNWTGKSDAEQGKIIGETPKGGDWRKALAEASADHMLRISVQMIDSAVSAALNDIKTLRYLADRFSDILYGQQESRERNKKLESV